MGRDCEGSCMVGITSWKRKRREEKRRFVVPVVVACIVARSDTITGKLSL